MTVFMDVGFCYIINSSFLLEGEVALPLFLFTWLYHAMCSFTFFMFSSILEPKYFFYGIHFKRHRVTHLEDLDRTFSLNDDIMHIKST